MIRSFYSWWLVYLTYITTYISPVYMCIYYFNSGYVCRGLRTGYRSFRRTVLMFQKKSMRASYMHTPIQHFGFMFHSSSLLCLLNFVHQPNASIAGIVRHGSDKLTQFDDTHVQQYRTGKPKSGRRRIDNAQHRSNIKKYMLIIYNITILHVRIL